MSDCLTRTIGALFSLSLRDPLGEGRGEGNSPKPNQAPRQNGGKVLSLHCQSLGFLRFLLFNFFL